MEKATGEVLNTFIHFMYNFTKGKNSPLNFRVIPETLMLRVWYDFLLLCSGKLPTITKKSQLLLRK